MLGNRKSEFSPRNEEIFHKVLSEERSDEFYECIILDICGGHKPKSRFLPEENFDFGIHLVVASYDLEKIFSVRWSGSYEELRLLGTDENITGRKCYLLAKSARTLDLQNARVTFFHSRTSSYQNEGNQGYTSIGGLYDCVGNYEMQFNSYSEDSKEGFGEYWERIK